MSAFVVDTHAVYGHLTDDPRLSPTAHHELQRADEGFNRVFILGIALVEMTYLVEKGRLDREPVERLLGILDTVDGSYVIAPLDQGTARALGIVSRSQVPDMPDRIIVQAMTEAAGSSHRPTGGAAGV